MECEFCKKVFTGKNNLRIHQTKATYCLKIQEKTPEISYACSYCSKIFNRKDSFDVHIASHLSDPIFIKLQKAEEEIKYHKEQYIKIEEQYKYQIKYLEEQYKNQIKELENIIENNSKELKIQYLTKKYVKKQAREKFKERYVMYILTTESLKKDRRYILGKAENLTNRLSTYNKTDEHEVVYYQKCGDEDGMKTVENLVFQKLKEYREQANRERFVLPEDKEVELFIDVVKKCVEFISI